MVRQDKKYTILLIGFSLLVGFSGISFIYNKIIKAAKEGFDKQIIMKDSTISLLNIQINKLEDSIQKLVYEDSLVLEELFPELQLREGFSDFVYCDKKRLKYQGYGHMKLEGENWPEHITKPFADSILKIDIKKYYLIVKRLDKLGLKKRVKKMFISGKY